ncbi:hypothetical protein SAMN05444355_101380 [Flavobacterium frigoris]|uniref:Uncharacterized protein n=1 Tax=Flavobacterium frigoris TaxID=229204 RepID=A0A1H9D5V8_FLAFI|nr:hypothetical protein SAMN05444355_101380 [Flavobacterium frigoris]
MLKAEFLTKITSSYCTKKGLISQKKVQNKHHCTILNNLFLRTVFQIKFPCSSTVKINNDGFTNSFTIERRYPSA